MSNPLAKLHLDSLRIISEDLVNRSSLFNTAANTHDLNKWAGKINQWQQETLKNLPTTGFDLQAHLASARPFLMALLLTLMAACSFPPCKVPVDFDPEKTYPLTVYLHGAGPRVAIDYLLTQTHNNQQDTLWKSGEDSTTVQSGQRQAILISPFGRGTKGYQGPSELDCWQAIDLTEDIFNIDPNRRYISGFSMGSAGALRLAARKPHYWAAINMAAGFHSAAHDPNLYYNIRGIPLYIWCGEDDERMINFYRNIVGPRMALNGVVPKKVTIAPDLEPHLPLFRLFRTTAILLSRNTGHHRSFPIPTIRF